jgi:hypothetical protein
MRYTKGSPITFTSDNSGWTAVFKNEHKTWTLPVIGWAVVPEWSTYEGEDRKSDGDIVKTRIEPVLLVDSYPPPMTLTDYRAEESLITHGTAITLTHPGLNKWDQWSDALVRQP